jgi:hypothetical protein
VLNLFITKGGNTAFFLAYRKMPNHMRGNNMSRRSAITGKSMYPVKVTAEKSRMIRDDGISGFKLRCNRARLNKRIIPIFNRSINRKARFEAVKLAGGRPRNAHLFLVKNQVTLCLFVFALLVKGISSGGALWI